jgi:hypothetical protein
VTTYRSSSKSTEKMNVQPTVNKISLQAHMELEFDVCGVAGKLVKYVVHLFEREKFKQNISLLTRCPYRK